MSARANSEERRAPGVLGELRDLPGSRSFVLWFGVLGPPLAWAAQLLLGVAAAGAAYALGRRALGARHRGPARRAAAFYAGLAAVAVALVSPVDTQAGRLLSVHMVQHLLLVLVAAPLLVRARPLVP